MTMILLKNCFYLVTNADDPGRSGMDLLIEGNRIARIAEEIEPPSGARVIDASKCVVIPGLVNTHHHFYQTLTRNRPAVEDAKLLD